MSSTSHPPAAKRPRLHVRQSCISCRKRKTKCDGKHPCDGCSKVSASCIYTALDDKPAKQASETHDYELPGKETRKIKHTPVKTSKRVFVPIKPRERHLIGSSDASLSEPSVPTYSTTIKPASEAVDIDEHGKSSYHGGNSSQSFLQQMRQQFGDFVNVECGRDMEHAALPVRQALEQWCSNNWRSAVMLPPPHMTEVLVHDAITHACGALVFVHRPSFFKMLDLVYNKPYESYGKLERFFLPLLYAALAVGFIFKNEPIGTPAKEQDLKDGARYYLASRQSLDVADIRDVMSLQALIFSAIFAAHTGQLRLCYSLISVVQTSALQMGLHRKLPSSDDLLMYETKKRAFWVIRRLELTIGGMLGLPQSLDEEDIDQELPSDVDDDYITEHDILPMPAEDTSVMAAVNAHIRLYRIMPRVLRIFSRTTGTKSSKACQIREISEIEVLLQAWVENLSPSFQPGSLEVTPQLERVRCYLRMSFSYVQMMLYRPFLRYISLPQDRRYQGGKCYLNAAACISVGGNLIRIVQVMLERKLLEGEVWFAVNATYFAIMSLAFYILQNCRDTDSSAILEDAETGYKIISSLATHSLWAHRCSIALKPVFDHFPKTAVARNLSSLPKAVERPASKTSFNDIQMGTRDSLESSYDISGTTNLPFPSVYWDETLSSSAEPLAYPTGPFELPTPNNEENVSYSSTSLSPTEMDAMFQDSYLSELFPGTSFDNMDTNDNWLDVFLQNDQTS